MLSPGSLSIEQVFFHTGPTVKKNTTAKPHDCSQRQLCQLTKVFYCCLARVDVRNSTGSEGCLWCKAAFQPLTLLYYAHSRTHSHKSPFCDSTSPRRGLSLMRLSKLKACSGCSAHFSWPTLLLEFIETGPSTHHVGPDQLLPCTLLLSRNAELLQHSASIF